MGMSFNGMVFPNPDLNKNIIRLFNKDMFLIPKRVKNKIVNIPSLLYSYNTSEEISKNIILFFHGNAEDMFGSSIMAKQLRNYLKMNVLIIEYPEYSVYDDSNKDANTILEDSTIIYDYIKDKFKLEPKNIFIFGRSIGTSPATYLASQRNAAGLFLVSAFTSIRAVAKTMVGALSNLLKERFLTKEYILNVKCPIMFIHGQKDPLIPFQETQELVRLFSTVSKEYNSHYPTFMTHNDFDIEKDILEPIKIFTNNFCKYESNLEKNSPNFEGQMMNLVEIKIDDDMKIIVENYLKKYKL